MLERRIRLGAEMPFAEMPRTIACVAEHLRQRDVIGLQARDTAGHEHTRVRVSLCKLLLEDDLRQVAIRRRDARAAPATSR